MPPHIPGVLPRWLQQHRDKAMTPGVAPGTIGAVARWYQATTTTPVTSIPEQRGGSPITQAVALRQPTIVTASNGVPVIQFDGTDVLVMPLDASGTGNNGTTKIGYVLGFKPSSVSDLQRLITVGVVAGGANVEKLQFYAFNAKLQCEVYMTNTTGRTAATTNNVLQLGVWSHIYLEYDSSRGGDANVRIYHNGVSEALTFTNIGAGATLGTLPTATGNAIVGAFNNAVTPIQPILANGQLMRDIYVTSDNLSTAQLAKLRSYNIAA
jgi:hypothetical protein